MTDQLVSIVLDASATGPPDAAHVEALRQEALALLEQGELAETAAERQAFLEKAANVMAQARDELARSQIATVTTVALTDEQIAQRDIDQAAGLQTHKAGRRSEVEQVLNWTDRWAARAVEEAVPMTAARIRYRQALRALFPQIDAAADVAAVEAITIPPPPPNP